MRPPRRRALVRDGAGRSGATHRRGGRGRQPDRGPSGGSRRAPGPAARLRRTRTGRGDRRARHRHGIAPDAPAKLFVTASSEVRAERRWRQLRGQGEVVEYEVVLADIGRGTNGIAAAPPRPWVRAPDAVLRDTTEMTIDEAADAARRIVEAARIYGTLPGRIIQPRHGLDWPRATTPNAKTVRRPTRFSVQPLTERGFAREPPLRGARSVHQDREDELPNG